MTPVRPFIFLSYKSTWTDRVRVLSEPEKVQAARFCSRSFLNCSDPVSVLQNPQFNAVIPLSLAEGEALGSQQVFLEQQEEMYVKARPQGGATVCQIRPRDENSPAPAKAVRPIPSAQKKSLAKNEGEQPTSVRARILFPTSAG